MKLLRLLSVLAPATCAFAQQIFCQPEHFTPPGQVLVTDGVGGGVKIQYLGAFTGIGTEPVDNAVSFFVVSPTTTTTFSGIQVVPNPAAFPYYAPGSPQILYAVFSTDATLQHSTGCPITVVIPAEPDPAVQAVVNAASSQPSFSPGAIVSIVGIHLTGPTQSTYFDSTGSFPRTVVGTAVLFNGTPAALLYVSPTQINALVPFSLSGQSTAQVVVQRFNKKSAPISISVQETSPAMFTAAQSGSGPAAILQQGADGTFTYNGSDNPVAAGAAIETFSTGMGVWNPTPEGDVFLFGHTFKTQPVSVTIGGLPAKILSAGTMGGGLPSASVLQVNVIVPDGLQSGAQPIVLKIGANDNSQQKVTLWVK